MMNGKTGTTDDADDTDLTTGQSDSFFVHPCRRCPRWCPVCWETRGLTHVVTAVTIFIG